MSAVSVWKRGAPASTITVRSAEEEINGIVLPKGWHCGCKQHNQDILIHHSLAVRNIGLNINAENVEAERMYMYRSMDSSLCCASPHLH